MKQSRIMSLFETFGGTILGFFISLGIQHSLVWWLELPLSSSQNVGIILIFTVASLIRGYVWRRLCEAMHIRVPLPASILAIAAERRRQIEAEGWDASHDDAHNIGELAQAGACYAMMPLRRELDRSVNPRGDWPWSREYWKPQDNRRDLVRSGALIVAELDKMDRRRRQKR